MLCKDKITSIFCIIDDILKEINHSEDIRRKVSDSEIITTAFIAATSFYGNHRSAIKVLLEGKEKTFSFEKLDANVEKIEASEYTKNAFRQVVSLHKSTLFRGDYSLRQKLKEEVPSNLPINEKKMLYALYTICDIIRDSNVAGSSFFKARCTIDGLDMLEAFAYGCIGGCPQIGVVCAFANLAFQAIRKC